MRGVDHWAVKDRGTSLSNSHFFCCADVEVISLNRPRDHTDSLYRCVDREGFIYDGVIKKISTETSRLRVGVVRKVKVTTLHRGINDNPQ